jgi:His-Xaa-Ser system protein HxsD
MNPEKQPSVPPSTIRLELDQTFFNREAVLKTCYWFSSSYSFEILPLEGNRIAICLTARQSPADTEDVSASFFSMATDFTLRELIESRTSSIRELLLAKAFAEAGVLEDSPAGVFGDPLEEAKPDGLFKILSNA